MSGTVRLGPPTDRAKLTVVAVHGRDQDPDHLVEHLVEPVDRSDVAWVLPAAPGRSWYPNGFMDPLETNQPHLDRALARLARLDIELAAAASGPVVWAGFSQGACLVAEHVARHPDRVAAAIVLTGGLMGPAGTRSSVAGRLDGVPVYVGVRDRDPWAPLARVRCTAETFTAAGAEVELDVFPGEVHEISAAEVRRATELIDRIRHRSG